MSMSMLRDFLICVPAAGFFAVLFRVPRRAIWVSAVLGGFGYVIYDLVLYITGSSIASYFTGTFILAVCSELLARLMKMPTTIFTIPAIVPLVPGIGLYNTMKYFVHNQGASAAHTGTTTILAIIAMSMAMVVCEIVTKGTKALFSKIKRHRRQA